MTASTHLGKPLYEVFLKYGNGAKEIGIVLTPRHITRFAARVVNVTSSDVLYDPCCGTGGFLVAGFDHVTRSSRPIDVDRFKQQNIWGVDQDTPVVTLAIVNMIFRGDGKNNISEGNCFYKHIVRGADGTRYSSTPAASDTEKAVTKVLMNPPFPRRQAPHKVYEFIDTALAQMQDHGLLFSVMPYPSLVKAGAFRTWRKTKLLRHNTLLCVLTLPPDLFYPVGVHTAGVFVRKGIPHDRDQNVLWVRGINDGMLKSKKKRLPRFDAQDDYPQIEAVLARFLADPSTEVPSQQMFMKACPINYNDPNFELVPEYYLDQPEPTQSQIADGIEYVIRDAAAFLIREGLEP